MIPAFLLPALPFMKRFWPYIAIGIAALVALKLWGDYKQWQATQDIAKKLNVESAEQLDAELERIAAEHDQAAREIADAVLAVAEDREHLEADRERLAEDAQAWEQQARDAQARARRYLLREAEREREVGAIAEGDLGAEWLAELCRLNPAFGDCPEVAGILIAGEPHELKRLPEN